MQVDSPGTYATPLDAIAAAVARKGGQAPAGRAFGVSQPTVWRWVNGKAPVTDKKVIKVEEETGVSRHDLRPDLYPREATPRPSGAPDDQLEPVR